MLLSSSPTAEWRRFDDSAALPRKHWVLFDSGLTIIDLLLERIAPSYSGILKPVKESNTNPCLVNVFCRATNSNLLAWNWNFCDLRQICESCGIFSWGKRPRAFNNFDEAGVKVLEEKKSLTKAIFAVTSSNENKACTGFELMTSTIPVQSSTNWANKPTGSRSLCWFQINPWSDESTTVNIWKSYIWTADKDVNKKAILAVMNTTWAVVTPYWKLYDALIVPI